MAPPGSVGEAGFRFAGGVMDDDVAGEEGGVIQAAAVVETINGGDASGVEEDLRSH